MTRPDRTRLRTSARALVVLLVMALAPLAAPSVATADDGIVELDRLAPGQTLGPPSTITTWGGVTLTVWSRSGTPNRFVMRRAVGATGTFTAVGVSMAGLTVINDARLLDDPKAKRTFLVANARGADLAKTLGTYVWVSTNQGASWSAPKKVWDSFGTANAALDGAGGLYLVVNLTGAQVVHVPASLAIQSYYDNDTINLGGRLGSRGAIDLGSAGTARTMLFAFQRSDGTVWVHRGLTPGTGAEIRLFDHYFGPTPVAGDTRIAAVGAIRAWSGNGNKYRVYVRSMNPTTGALGAVKQISSSTEEASPTTLGFDLVHLVTPNGAATGRFLAIWRTWNGELRYAKSLTTNPSGAWSAPITVKKATNGAYSNFTAPSGNQFWVVSNGYRKIGTQQYLVIVATRIATDR